ncbi:MAG: plasmid stabilization protein [Deltaproteobacteria bacterium]|nr:plasmid stabilization protein [Deltaproteobacteria bacterium]
MPAITIRNLDQTTKERLRQRAARHRRSMEEEARDILRSALARPDGPRDDLAALVRRRFQAIGGVELELPPRGPIREPPAPRR